MTLMISNLYRKGLLLFILLIASGCATKNPFEQEVVNGEQRAWMQSVINYPSSLANSVELTNTESMFAITEDMRTLVKQKFSHQRKDQAIENLARWLMSSDGHNMQYDLSANLTPIQAYNEKRGNCLSFTILLVSLAKVIDIELKYNDVYLPNFWGLEEEQNSYTLFRHVNAVRRSFDRTQIFDLAIEQYDYGFPQKEISEQQALAWLHSNLSIEKLRSNDLTTALHHMKLSIALFQEKSDFWVNLGVIYRKNKDSINAERAFLHALNLNDGDSLAASNLEKLYRQNNKIVKADYFKKKAFKAQQKNPYVHYKLADKHLQEKRFKLAKKSIRKAKRLHNQDPRFYVLSSIIEQHNNDYISAIKDIEKAYNLTVNAKHRSLYSQKAQLLAVKASNNQPREIRFEDVFNSPVE